MTGWYSDRVWNLDNLLERRKYDHEVFKESQGTPIFSGTDWEVCPNLEAVKRFHV